MGDGFRWNMGADAGGGNLDGRRLNDRLLQTAPQPGQAQALVGAGSQVTNQLSGGVLYVVTAVNDFRIVSSGSAPTATSADMIWPHEQPYYHLVKAGETDFVAVIDAAGASVDATIAPARNS